jgi:O-antigen/teichoic acid export membrane protein
MSHLSFNWPERMLALIAGVLNLIVGVAFFFLPELHLPLWPVSISSVLTRFIGAIIIGNSVGAIWLSTEREWARVRPLALVATVYGTIVALALLYHLLWLNASAFFWLYFSFDVPFLLVFYGLFIYHDIAPRIRKQGIKQVKTS